MKSKNNFLFGVALLFCQVVMAEQSSGGLDGSIKYDGSFGYDFILQNKNSYFICIARSNVNTYDKLLTLKNDKGEKLIPRSFKDTGVFDTELGVDFIDSYYIVRPGESKKFYLDMTNFELQEGKYEYLLQTSVFKCKDVFDEPRIKAKREVKPILIEKKGTIEFDNEFIKSNKKFQDENKDCLPPPP